MAPFGNIKLLPSRETAPQLSRTFKVIKFDHVFALALMAAGFGLAVPVWAEDLLAIYQLAEQEDPQLKQIEASYQATRELKPQARAQLMLPSVNANANVARNFQDISPAFAGFPSRTEFTSWEYLLTLSQPVYHYDLYVQYQQADHRIKQAYTELGAAQQELIVRVAERYFAVLAAMDNLDFVVAEKKALSQQLDYATQRFEVGLIAITDVQEAQAGYDQAVAREIEAVNLLDNTREALRELTSEYPKALFKLGETIPLIAPEPADIDQWTAKALEQNLRLLAASQASDIAREEIARQSAGHYPTLDLVASHGTLSTGGRFGTVEITETEVGLEFNLPIYQGGQVNSRTREAQYRYDEALERLEQERRAAQRQTHDGYLGVILGISRVKALKQAVISNQTSVEATQAGFEVGTRTGLDVVNAQRQLLQAQRDYARSRYDYILDTLRLKRAAGTLAPADLVKINTWLSR